MVIQGVIRPPPEIRAVADRTALYVAKNGRAFEARILKSAKGKTPKFAFLHETSPFHAYYEDRIQFYENGGEDSKEGDDTKENNKSADEDTKKDQKSKSQAVVVAETTQKASAIDPIAKALLAERNRIQQARAKQKEESEKNEADNGDENGQDANKTNKKSTPFPLPPPPGLELVSIVAPSNLTAVQIETIQLVAQFSAMDGKGGPFLRQLTLREWNNSAFNFCQPRHAHFAYFSALVDAYRKIIAQWTSAAAANGKSEETKTTTVEEDAQAFLQQAAYRAEYEREMQQLRSEQEEEGEIVAIDWHDFVVVETIDFAVDEKVEIGMLPPPPPPETAETKAVVPAKAAAAAAAANGDDMDESDDDEEEAIRVVPSYTPKVVGAADLQTARAIDPITGKSVPVADIPEHLRIQLLDPKWAEERKKFQEKQKDSNLVSGDAIASNISRFAQARGDLFGKSVSGHRVLLGHHIMMCLLSLHYYLVGNGQILTLFLLAFIFHCIYSTGTRVAVERTRFQAPSGGSQQDHSRTGSAIQSTCLCRAITSRCTWGRLLVKRTSFETSTHGLRSPYY